MMNKTTIKLVAITAALSITAGCARKPPANLPPDPPAQGTGTTGQDGWGQNPGGVGSTALPGSRADFLQNVPSDRVFFDTDSHTIDARARSVLDAQAAWLLRNPAANVSVEGHADERGTREYNLALGDRRANAAKNYLAARGVPAHRMTTVSWGKERPVAEGSNEAAWAQNRRAVTVVPN